MTTSRTNGAPSSILVTGASGFLGGAVARALTEAGKRVIASDVVSRLGAASVRHLDLCDPDAIHELLASEKPDAVVHCAAYGHGDAGLLASGELEPAKAARVNVLAFRDLLQACREAGVTRVVWSSSTTVYGPPRCYVDAEKVTEEHPPAPTTVYGATKMLAERLGEQYFDEGTFEPVALRLPLVYGPGRWYGGAQAGWLSFVEQAAAGSGGEYRFDDAEADWIYVDDAVEAIRLALTTASIGRSVFNVAGAVTSPFGMARLVAEATGNRCRVEREGKERELVLIDGGAFARATGYEPTTRLAQGVEALIESLGAEKVGSDDG